MGQHVLISLHFKDQAVQRSYTPVRPVLPTEEDGTFDLLVKTYLPSEGEAFSPGGTISNYLDCMEKGTGSMISRALVLRLRLGEEIDIRGPSGGICYLGRGKFMIQGTTFHFDKVRSPSRWDYICSPHPQINLIAGGSGLTPHWQLIYAILSDPEDKTLISLLDRYDAPSARSASSQCSHMFIS